MNTLGTAQPTLHPGHIHMNYRINENPLIHETIAGFSSLKKKLPEWIEEKKEEYKEVK